MEEVKEMIEETVEVSAPAETSESMEDIAEDLEKSIEAGPQNDEDPAWDKFDKMMADKEVFEVKVDSIVKGGAIAFVDDVRAFIPASKISTSRVENLDEFKGKKLDVIVIGAEREKKNLVLSARDAAFAKRDAEREAAQAAINEGDILTGTVESLKDYGAFVKLESGATGLLHVSRISWKRVDKPEDVLTVGQEVKVKVVKKESGKISLSIKDLEERPEGAKKFDKEGSDKPREPKFNSKELNKYNDNEKASTSLGDLLSGIKL